MNRSIASPFLSAGSAQRPQVAIIGGGVIGLGIGWRLAAAGCAVELFERGEAGSGASRVAAGMLAAGVETESGEEALFALNRESQLRWPAFAEELEAASGLPVERRDDGTLVVALSADDIDPLHFTAEFQRSLGIELHWLTGAEARRREPHLAPGVAAACYSPGDHQVDSRKLAAALETAFRRHGGRLHERSPVVALEMTNGRASGVRLATCRRPADIVVLAAGAWSREIAGIPPEALPPVRPIKGQTLVLRMDTQAPLLRHVVWAPRVYLVPRRDGRLILGATVEERGFDGTLTAGAVFTLLEAAWRALPAIEALSIEETAVGFRPGSPDDAPILGPSGIEGLVLATGHHRNGILLTPVTADEVSRCVLTGETSAAIRPFGIDRFAPAAPRATEAAQ